MLEFVRKNFRKFAEIALWLNLVLCMIVGWILGGLFGQTCSHYGCSSDGYPFLGALLGLVVGILIDIVCGGFIATFLEIGENLKIVKDYLRVTSSDLKSPVAVQLGSFTDPRDNQTYKTVKIGEQTWLAENLNYNASGSKCYNNDESNCEKYGRLYDWNTALKACPSGWHLPNDDEWQRLVDIAGGYKVAGTALKAASGWNEDGNGTNKFGFSALPGGHGHSDGSFGSAGSYGDWWSATEIYASLAYGRSMNYYGNYVYRYNDDKSYLFSVRCLKD